MYAFPSGHNPKTGTQESGMTLRDYFAGQALIGLIGCYSNKGSIDDNELAEISYDLADEMMKARGS